MEKIFTFIVAFLVFQNVFAQGTFVFFGSYNWDKTTEGIYVYELDTTRGKLTKISSVTGVANPSYLSLSADGKFLFACTESKTPNAGSVSSFSFDPLTKKLTFLNSQPSGGENPVYLSAHKNGKWLLNGNYTESSISAYPVENGQINAIAQHFKFTEGSHVNSNRQATSHIHSAVFSPDYTYAFFPDLGSDKIRIFSFDSTQNTPLKPTQQAYVDTEPGSGPRHFTFHPNERFAYTIEELSGTVNVYSFRNGILESLQRVSTHKPSLTAGFESSDIHISPDGRFLYASNRGKENNLAIFKIAEDGTLKNIGFQSTKGKHPRVFALDESGKFLIATNVNTGNAVVFKRNQETGLLKKVSKETKLKNVTCAKIKRYKA